MTEETKVASTEEKVEKSVEEKKEGKKCCGLGSCKKDCRKKGMILAIVVLLLLVAASFGYKAYRDKIDIGQEAIKAKVQKFADENVQPGVKPSIKEVTKENNLYKITITVGSQDVVTYASTDGKKLFSGVAELDPKADESKQQAAQKDIPKSDKPEVKLFVMSYCPYGTQMEKGILPVLDTLKDKIDYKLEFVDYAMHGKKELDENMLQYCIQKTQPAKFNAYLSCFLKKGEGTSDACMKTAGVASAQAKGCVAQTDKEFNVTKLFNDKASWNGGQFPPFNINKEDNGKYGVQGSPSLVINGILANAGRDSASILQTICGAFNNQPEECKKQLSSSQPAPGFGDGTAPASAGSAAAGCASPTK